MSKFEDCMSLLYERSPFRVGYWLFVPLYFLVTVAGRKLRYSYGDGYNTGGICVGE